MDIFSSLCAQDCFAFGIWESCAGANSGGQNVSEFPLPPSPSCALSQAGKGHGPIQMDIWIGYLLGA